MHFGNGTKEVFGFGKPVTQKVASKNLRRKFMKFDIRMIKKSSNEDLKKYNVN